MTIGYLATSIGYYDQHRLIVCIGRTSATDENVQSDENVPSPGRKRPRFRATSTKMSYILSKACQAQGRKRPRFSKDENVPHSEQQVPKCPTFRVRLVKQGHLFVAVVWKSRYLQFSATNREIGVFPRRTAKSTIFRDKSRYNLFFATDRKISSVSLNYDRWICSRGI